MPELIVSILTLPLVIVGAILGLFGGALFTGLKAGYAVFLNVLHDQTRNRTRR